jgi:hypothetical protein
MLKHTLKQPTKLRTAVISIPVWLVMLTTFTTARAQQPQIPTLQVCNLPSVIDGTGTVTIVARQPGGFTGSFTVEVQNVKCDPSTGYPTGSLTISGISMNDSLVEGTIVANTIDQLTSTGRATPTAYLNGRCSVDSSGAQNQFQGCRYWIMFANNNSAAPLQGGTQDVVSLLVFNKFGQRIAYGTGPVVRGHISVAPTSF